ncbi:MAG: tetratricopeptide repeat protein [Anaerolineae bacterium]|nr:tetratricopeptide repeat protein [Anaerolineae bacterium]
MQSGQFSEAVATLERAYELIPDDVPTAINLGGACVMTKRYAWAIEVLERAREQEPDNEMIWINLGAAYLGNPILADDKAQRAAIDAFERALEINPVARSVHYNLGLIHRDRGEWARAARRFEQAIQADPRDQDACNALARLQAQQPSDQECDERID